MEERRQTPRILIPAHILIWDEEGYPIDIPEAKIHNMGQAGFAFAADPELFRGKTYQFRIDLDGKKFNLKGEIVHRRNKGTYYAYGVKIKSVPFFQKSQLTQIVTHKTKRFRWRAFVVALIFGGLVWAGIHFFLGVHWGFGLAALALTIIFSILLIPF